MSLRVAYYSKDLVGPKSDSAALVKELLSSNHLDTEVADLKWIHPRTKNHDHNFLIDLAKGDSSDKQYSLKRFFKEQYNPGDKILIWVPSLLVSHDLCQVINFLKSVNPQSETVELIELAPGRNGQEILNKISPKAASESEGKLLASDLMLDVSCSKPFLLGALQNYTYKAFERAYNVLINESPFSELSLPALVKEGASMEHVYLDLNKDSSFVADEILKIAKHNIRFSTSF